MAKARSKEPASETPFQRFERLAREIVAVPKREIDKRQRKWEKDRAKK
ncbi:MAG TPA: hypothetical protein VEZ14_07045 [Dehalococcoidia bacterium]|nr:hypothetical protein [Dehalococcoidia bacterium]